MLVALLGRWRSFAAPEPARVGWRGTAHISTTRRLTACLSLTESMERYSGRVRAWRRIFARSVVRPDRSSRQQSIFFVSYDRRAMQLRRADHGYSVIAHAEDLRALLGALRIREAHFVASFARRRHRPRSSSTLSSIHPPASYSPMPPYCWLGLSEVFSKSVQEREIAVMTRELALQRRNGAKTSSFTRIAQSRPESRVILRRMVDQYSLRNYMHALHDDFTAAINVGPWNDREFPDMAQFGRPMLMIVGAQTHPFFINGAGRRAIAGRTRATRKSKAPIIC